MHIPFAAFEHFAFLRFLFMTFKLFCFLFLCSFQNLFLIFVLSHFSVRPMFHLFRGEQHLCLALKALKDFFCVRASIADLICVFHVINVEHNTV